MNKNGFSRCADIYIGRLREEGRYSTAHVYQNALLSFSKFCGVHSVSFRQVTRDRLRRYEQHLYECGLKPNTISTYMRMLRSIYNRGVEAGSAPYVHRLFTLSRTTANEAHHLLGFLRFSELENGVLFSTIHPKNNALPILAEHFTDRLPQENFMIYDENRQLAAVHAAGKNFMLVDASGIDQDLLKRTSEKESAYRKLWLAFFDQIAIQARINPKLQAQNIPKRFWSDTPELAKK